jgi:hypothetical protein
VDDVQQRALINHLAVLKASYGPSWHGWHGRGTVKVHFPVPVRVNLVDHRGELSL